MLIRPLLILGELLFIVKAAELAYQKPDSNVLVKEKMNFPPAPNPGPSREPPAVETLDACPFSRIYIDVGRLINQMRYGLDDQFNICMNEKLMMASKWQSDFENVFGDPTHVGPIGVTPAYASVEERVAQAKFNFTNGLKKPEQIIYYWKKFPKNPSLEEEKELLNEAFKVIQERSPEAKKILNDSDYRFFGVGVSRNIKTGSAYMAIVLADSTDESCHVCRKLPNGDFGRITPKKKFEERKKKRKSLKKRGRKKGKKAQK